MLVGSSWFGSNQENTYTKELKKLGEQLGSQLLFTGFIPKKELPKFYAISEIFCLPSIMEDPSPNVCYEAQASGLPILSSNRGGIPEIVKSGETAFFFNNPEDYQDIAEKLEQFIKNFEGYANFGKAGRQRAEEKFSWKKTAEKAESVYQQFLE